MKKSANDIYQILHQIGRGSYASVHKAINRKTGELCAIKKIPFEASEFTNLKNEINILKDCECKNIVRFLYSDCLSHEVSIYLEYCCGGSVKDVMRALKRTIGQDQIIVIIRDVLNGLDYLHSKKKTHRDVKAANILLDGEGIAKLGDFGVSEPSDTTSQKQSLIGTLLWLPPEVINKDCKPNRKPLIDIWSLGITIIEMAEGDPPYYDLEQKAALVRIANLTMDPPTFRNPNEWSQQMNDFLALCLDKDTSRRKTAGELLTCEIIKKCPSNELIKVLVEEVCCLNSEKNLRKKSRHLRLEFEILDNIYDERKKKVLRLEPLTLNSEALKRDFDELFERNRKRDQEIKKMESQLECLVSESRKLESDRNEIETALSKSKDRAKELSRQLSLIEMKLRKIDLTEVSRRMKLSTLES